MENTTQKKVVLSTTEIVLPQLDVSKYIGTDASIELVEEFEGQYGYYVKVSTQVLDIINDIKDDEGKPLQLRASRIFGLGKDSDGNIGWGKDTKLGLYLTKSKVKHYNELKGKMVKVMTTTAKDGKDYLSFN